MKFTVPFPPSANRIWRHVGRKVLLSAEGRDYHRRVCAALLDQAKTLGFLAGLTRPASYDARLRISIDAYMPDRKRRDVDNLIKATLDALQRTGVYENDSQIDSLTINRREVDPMGGWLEITLETMNGK